VQFHRSTDVCYARSMNANHVEPLHIQYVMSAPDVSKCIRPHSIFKRSISSLSHLSDPAIMSRS
jgi:hypothetical protein